MVVIIIDLTSTDMVQRTLTTITHATMMIVQRQDPMSKKHHAMISFPLLLKRMGVFIFVLIHFLSHMHISLLHIISGLF
jgi:uncharacterized protein YaaQ